MWDFYSTISRIYHKSLKFSRMRKKGIPTDLWKAYHELSVSSQTKIGKTQPENFEVPSYNKPGCYDETALQP